MESALLELKLLPQEHCLGAGEEWQFSDPPGSTECCRTLSSEHSSHYHHSQSSCDCPPATLKIKSTDVLSRKEEGVRGSLDPLLSSQPPHPCTVLLAVCNCAPAACSLVVSGGVRVYRCGRLTGQDSICGAVGTSSCMLGGFFGSVAFLESPTLQHHAP